MPNLNKVMLMGNLTRDPDTTYTPKGTACCNIGLAVNRVWHDNEGEKMEDTTFVDITFWGKQAETIQEYMRKGRPLYVEGRLQLDQWEDKQSGQKRSKLKVVGESFQFLGGKGGDKKEKEEEPQGERRFKRGGRGSEGEAPRRPAPPPQKPRDPDLDQPEDDIPF